MISETDTSMTITSSSEADEEDEFSEVFDSLNDDSLSKTNDCIVINQFVSDVIDISSQYGSDFSISYTACNISGKPSKYPDYGDFPETFAFRTYGNWWNTASSRCTNFMLQNFADIPKIDDYIVCQFENYVYPHELHIFETYNPGAIVRIWVYTISEQWVLMWDKSQDDTHYALERHVARIFSPKLKKIILPTRILRLEFNHLALPYFTEIDAVMLIGKKYTCLTDPKQMLKKHPLICGEKGPIQKKLELEQFRPLLNNNREKIMQEFLKTGLCEFIREAGLSLDTDTEDESNNSSSDDNNSYMTLNHLPYEILFKIFSYLDLKSLYRCSRVCRTLHNIAATDPLLYTEISLKPYWNCTTSSVLRSLSKRCKSVKKFDLSWCGLFNKINAGDFKDFIKSCGDNLTHLRLNSCKFLSQSCIDRIGMNCSYLKELSIQNYHSISNDLSGLYLLRHLERLDLCRTDIATPQLLNILKMNSNLKHLNLGFCGLGVNMDEVAVQISHCNKNIVSIDMWKSHSLTSIGLDALSTCYQLEEVDFGWCLREEASPGESLRMLVKNCPKLKKLFLAAIRGLNDRDLDVIATHCTQLEQLDLMGIMGISTEMCYKILCKCKKLQLIDLSFCDQLDTLQIELWREIFDASIKRSLIDFPI